jgi:hypothetical protein
MAHEVACATKIEPVLVNRVDGNPLTPDEILKRIKDVSV